MPADLQTPLVRAVLTGLAGVIILLPSALNRPPVQEPDEAAWLFSTPFAQLFFTGQFHHDGWSNIDAIDHPPVGKYLIGACARMAGPLPADLSDKDFWHRFDIDMLRRPQFLQELERRLDPNQLLAARIGGTVATGGAVGILTWLGEILVPGVGVAAGLLLAFHPLAHNWGAAALADPWFLLFALLAVALSVTHLRCLKSAIRSYHLGPAIGLGVVLGLLAGIKITGLALWGLPVIVLAGRRWLKVPWRSALIDCAVTISVSVVLFFGLNPALWDSPFATLLAMLSHRMERVDTQQLLFSFDAIEYLPTRLWLGLADPLGTYGYQRFNPFGPEVSWLTMGGAAIAWALVASGLMGFMRKVESEKESVIAVISTVAFGLALMADPALWGYYLRWPRYLLPTLPLWALLIGYGIMVIKDHITAQRAPSRSFYTTLVIGAALGLILTGWHPPTADGSPERVTQREAKQTELEQHYGRIHATTVLRLADKALSTGQHARALELLRFAQTLDPDNVETESRIEALLTSDPSRNTQ
jgi:hypothetical protein